MSLDERHQRLAAILAADAAGYSRLMSLDEASTLAALDAARAVFRSHIESNHGRVIDMAGDSVLAAFETAAGAVKAALAIQNGLESLVAGVPADRRMRFRIGVHLGDVIEKSDGTVYGDGVNIAARLEGLALPGGVTISDAVHGAVRHRIAATFEDLGERQVKNIVDPVRVFRVLQAGALDGGAGPVAAPAPARVGRLRGWFAGSTPWRTGSRLAVVAALIGVMAVALMAYLGGRQSTGVASSAASPAMSVAIMPLAASDGDPAMAQRAQHWSDTIAAMVALSDTAVRVVPGPGPQAGAAAANRDVGALMRSLNVGYLLEGNLRSGPDGVIGDMRLTNGATGERVWSGSASVKPSATRDDEMRALRRTAYAIMGSLEESEIRRVLAQPASDGTAMDYTLRARAVGQGGEAGTVQRTREAQRLYEEALRRDPNFVPALIGLGYEMSSEIDSNPQVDFARAVRRWDELTSQAVRLNSARPGVWASRWGALAYLGQWNASVEAVERAVQLDPYGAHVVTKGHVLALEAARPAEGVALVEQYLVLGPTGGFFYPLRVLCEAYVLMGEYEKAIARCERAKGLNAEDWWVDLFLAAAYANHGDMAKATAARDEVLRLVPGYSMARLKANAYSTNPEFIRLAEANYHSGLRKAGLPEN